jgi:hypothetical protein
VYSMNPVEPVCEWEKHPYSLTVNRLCGTCLESFRPQLAKCSLPVVPTVQPRVAYSKRHNQVYVQIPLD